MDSKHAVQVWCKSIEIVGVGPRYATEILAEYILFECRDIRVPGGIG